MQNAIVLDLTPISPYVVRFLYDGVKRQIDEAPDLGYRVSELGTQGLATLLLTLAEGLHDIADRDRKPKAQTQD